MLHDLHEYSTKNIEKESSTAAKYYDEEEKPAINAARIQKT